MLKRGDLALAFGILTILVVLILPLPSVVLDMVISITLSILILNDVTVHPGAAGILLFPDRAADCDHAAAVAQPRLNTADPIAPA